MWSKGEGLSIPQLINCFLNLIIINYWEPDKSNELGTDMMKSWLNISRRGKNSCQKTAGQKKTYKIIFSYFLWQNRVTIKLFCIEYRIKYYQLKELVSILLLLPDVLEARGLGTVVSNWFALITETNCPKTFTTPLKNLRGLQADYYMLFLKSSSFLIIE